MTPAQKRVYNRLWAQAKADGRPEVMADFKRRFKAGEFAHHEADPSKATLAPLVQAIDALVANGGAAPPAPKPRKPTMLQAAREFTPEQDLARVRAGQARQAAAKVGGSGQLVRIGDRMVELVPGLKELDRVLPCTLCGRAARVSWKGQPTCWTCLEPTGAL